MKIAIPQSYIGLLGKLLEEAILDLSYETIKPVYQMISSLDIRSFDDLPNKVLCQLQDSLIMVLMAYGVEDVSTSLFCLAVLARLAYWDSQYPACSGSSDNQHDDTGTLGQTLQPARQFFSAKRASKTLDLVVLKAIVICSSTSSLAVGVIRDSLKRCSEVVRAIASCERSSWITRNLTKVKKLTEKVLQPDLDDGVRWRVSLRRSHPYAITF